ncbi:MAG: DUF4091 domain-containing protein [Armatimonadetes bacterium]|nr:DUF4091 domain-containing protein [Armatimonadota bacterium]
MVIRRIVLPICILLALAEFNICAEEVEKMPEKPILKVWLADSLIKIFPDTPPSDTLAALKIDAVRNEYESAQLVVTPDRNIENLTVKVSQFTGPSKVAPRVEAHFVGYVHIEKGTPETPPEYLITQAPSDIPDVLLEAKSVSVKASQNQPIWFTIYVPKNAEPGIYRGEITIEADSTKVNTPLEVKVYPATLPDERTLYLTNWFSHSNIAKFHGLEMWSEPYWKMLEAYARCMAEHRQNVVITPIMDLIAVHYDSSGNRTLDFSRFDRWVELFKKAGVIGTIEGGHLGGRSEWEAKDFDAHWPRIYNPDGSIKPNPKIKTTSEEEQQFLSWFMPALQKHLEEKGWIGIYIQHLADEPIPANAESYKKLSSWVREFAPKLRIIDACTANEIAGAIDIWVPLPQHFESHVKFFRERQALGEEVWFYTCLTPKGKYMNRLLDFHLIRTRLLHWLNFKYGLTGYLHWGFNYWRGDPYTDWQSDWLPPGDSHIVYPGKRGSMSSIRLEALRDGVEDFELLKLLEKKHPRKARQICNSVVRTMTDYTLDPSEFREARRRLIEEVSK